VCCAPCEVKKGAAGVKTFLELLKNFWPQNCKGVGRGGCDFTIEKRFFLTPKRAGAKANLENHPVPDVLFEWKRVCCQELPREKEAKAREETGLWCVTSALD
jgi:hypothetical protein